MQIICKDGTTIQCENFEAIDSGVLFFQESTPRRAEASEEDEDEDEEETELSADGFVPITELHFVLPDEMVQQVPSQQAATTQQGRAPPKPPQQGGMAQQQQMQQPPGSPGQPNR